MAFEQSEAPFALIVAGANSEQRARRARTILARRAQRRPSPARVDCNSAWWSADDARWIEGLLVTRNASSSRTRAGFHQPCIRIDVDVARARAPARVGTCNSAWWSCRLRCTAGFVSPPDRVRALYTSSARWRRERQEVTVRVCVLVLLSRWSTRARTTCVGVVGWGVGRVGEGRKGRGVRERLLASGSSVVRKGGT